MAKLLSGTRVYGNTTIDTYLSVGANVSANSVKVTEYYEFSDGTKQYTANAGVSTATGAYEHANGAFDKANSANVLAQSAFDKSNSANVLAQSAFDKANSGVLTVSLIDANNDVSNVVTTVTGLRFDTESGFDVTDLGSGNVKIGMNSTFKTWKVAGQTDLVATGLDTVEFKSANGISITTGPLDTPKSITFDGGPLYEQINTKFSSSGGTITGSATITQDLTVNHDVGISGNLIVTGKTVFANTQTVLIADNIITLNAAIDQTSAPTSNSGITIDRGSEPNVFLMFDEDNDYWAFTNDGTIFHKIGSDADIITVYNTVNTTINIANTAFVQANAAYDQANTGTTLAQAGYDQANTGTTLAQAAYDAANTASGAGANSFGIIATNNATVLAQQANDAITFYGDGGISVGADAINKRIVISVPAGYVFNSADYGWVDEPTTTIFDYGTI